MTTQDDSTPAGSPKNDPAARRHDPIAELTPQQLQRIHELIVRDPDEVFEALKPELPAIAERLMERLKHRMDAIDRQRDNRSDRGR